MSPPLTGIIVATLTPYDRRGRVDPGMVREHVAYLIEHGVTALAPVGTTGEFLYLEEREKLELLTATVQAASGRARVVAGIWALDAEGVGRLARGAESAGADAVFLTTPIYYRYAEDALFDWYRNAATEAELPLFCYHIPAYSGNEVSLELFGRLVSEGHVAGIKDSSASAERLTAALRVPAGPLGPPAVYGASDSFARQARALGAHGFISALANIFPRAFVRIWEGDDDAQAAVDQVRNAVKGYGGLAALKYLLARRGFAFGGTRLPFSELDDAARQRLDAAADALPET